MKLKAIEFKDQPDFENGVGGAFPDRITVEMTVRQAVLLTKLLQRMNAYDREAIVSGADDGFTMYYCLVGDVFNRYWETGVDGAVADLGMQPTEKAVKNADEYGSIIWRKRLPVQGA